MPSNLPPGVRVSDIPGNRPEDAEIDLTFTLCVGDITTMEQFVKYTRKNKCMGDMQYLVELMLEQAEGDRPDLFNKPDHDPQEDI